MTQSILSCEQFITLYKGRVILSTLISNSKLNDTPEFVLIFSNINEKSNEHLYDSWHDNERYTFPAF